MKSALAEAKDIIEMSAQKESILIAHDLNWFQLGTIISTSLTLPMISVGQQLAKTYGIGTTICSILVGNLILWLIAIAVNSMAMENRSNAIGNVKQYLGKYGAIFMWLILMAALLNWFVNQINSVMPSIGSYLGNENNSTLVRIGAGIGFFTTLLSIGGIRIIKWLIVTSFPLIFLYHLYIIFHSNIDITPIGEFGLSKQAIISTALVLVPGIINLPTLFRHARSKPDSYLGLTLMIFLISLFEISAIWMKLTEAGTIEFFGPKHSFISIATLAFIVATMIYMNLLNIYFASACWETYVPRFEGSKGYVIIGLMGTAIYAFIQIHTPIRLIDDLTNAYLASLGTVLLFSYLTRIIVRHRPRNFEKILNGICWLIGCLVSTFLIFKDINTYDGVHVLLSSASATALTFLCIIFVEEGIWAIQKILMHHKD